MLGQLDPGGILNAFAPHGTFRAGLFVFAVGAERLRLGEISGHSGRAFETWRDFWPQRMVLRTERGPGRRRCRRIWKR